jgi:hypothetical protein
MLKVSTGIASHRYDTVRRIANSLRGHVAAKSSQYQGGTTGPDVVALSATLAQARVDLLSGKEASVPGINQWAKDQENDQAYNLDAEIDAVVAQIDVCLATIQSILPTSAGGYLDIQTLGADGLTTPRAVSGGPLNGLRSDMDALVALIG